MAWCGGQALEQRSTFATSTSEAYIQQQNINKNHLINGRRLKRGMFCNELLLMSLFCISGNVVSYKIENRRSCILLVYPKKDPAQRNSPHGIIDIQRVLTKGWTPGTPELDSFPKGWVRIVFQTFIFRGYRLNFRGVWFFFISILECACGSVWLRRSLLIVLMEVSTHFVDKNLQLFYVFYFIRVIHLTRWNRIWNKFDLSFHNLFRISLILSRVDGINGEFNSSIKKELGWACSSENFSHKLRQLSVWQHTGCGHELSCKSECLIFVEDSISKEFEKVVSKWSHGVLVCLKAVKLTKTKSEKPQQGRFSGSMFSLKHSTSSNLVIQISLVLIFLVVWPLLASFTPLRSRAIRGWTYQVVFSDPEGSGSQSGYDNTVVSIVKDEVWGRLQ